MKPRSLVSLSLALLIAAALNAAIGGTAGAASAPASAAATLNGPTISSIRLEGTNVAVTAQIPAGVNVVTLEGRTRLGAGGWIPRAVLHLDGTGGEVTFHAARSGNLEVLRVRAEATATLPASFYQGTKTFAGPAGASGAVGPPVYASAAGDSTRTVAPAPTDANRTVVESDIWKIANDTLYFFNQYRGLQIIDVTSPDKPVVRGTLELPAAGEQMYLLDNNYVVLLARDGCGWDANGPASMAMIVKVVGGVPSIAATLPIAGNIQESRLVGTALYVAAEVYRKSFLPTKPDGTTSETWEYGSTISAFDLADPSQPVARESLWSPGYGNVITATDRFLFVATQGTDLNNYWQSDLRIIDISAPNGTIKDLAKFSPQGRVADKFKMDLNGDVFTVISEKYDQRASRPNNSWVTKLETFSLTTPTDPKKLGELELGHGERLFATRFDNDRVYVVTFFVKDPLWVVDLTDPANPKLSGQLEVPGWSTYIQPLGDRLVTVGIDNSNSWRVAVSLFDVKDPTKPSLLSKVPLGENYSWSEVNSDEKALTVLPDAGLILVPYQGNTTNGYTSRVQLIDLGATSLTARGAIEHRLQPRRATVHGNRVLSISGRELITVDATDRDHPAVTSDTALSWSVDRLFVQGDYLLELSNGNSWNSEDPTLRVTLASQVDQELDAVNLGKFPVLGATLKSGRLYVAQGQVDTGIIYILDDKGNQVPVPDTNSPNLFLSIFDVSQLPKVTQLGQTSVVVPQLGWSPNLQPVWPKPEILVWSGGSGWPIWWGWGGGGIVPLAGIARDVASPSFARPWFWGGSGGRLLAFDVGNANAPQFKSNLDLGTNGWWSFSSTFATDGLAFLSHQTSEFLEGVLPPGQLPPPPAVVIDKETGQVITNQPIIGTWVQKYFLDVVDYSDAANPTQRKPVNIPGTLQGVSVGGALLYTTGYHYDPATFTTDNTEWLDASAYDGVSASLVDSHSLSPSWPHPVLVDGKNLFIGRPAETDKVKNLLEVWTLADTGKFVSVANPPLVVPSAAQNLAVFGDLLAVQISNDIQLYNKAAPSAMVFLGEGGPQGCLGYTLGNADGAVDRGLWLPLGDYGVARVGVNSATNSLPPAGSP